MLYCFEVIFKMDPLEKEVESSSSDDDNNDPDYCPEEEPKPANRRLTEKYREIKLRKVYDHYQQVKKTKLLSTAKKFKMTTNEVYATLRHFDDKAEEPRVG